jgi:predicted TIM-barrel fold metal-dependent hydrolase
MGIMARCVDDAIGYWVQETADLFERPNIYVKVSALPGYSTQPFPNLNIEKYVREMVDKMGPQRCFFGTDVTRLMVHGISWTDTIEQFTKHYSFTQEELEWIMGRGICEVLDWPVPAGMLAQSPALQA